MSNSKYHFGVAYDSRKDASIIEDKGGWRPNTSNGFRLPWKTLLQYYPSVSNFHRKNLIANLRCNPTKSFQDISSLTNKRDNNPVKDLEFTHNHMVVNSRTSPFQVVVFIFSLSLILLVMMPLSSIYLGLLEWTFDYFLNPAINLIYIFVLAIMFYCRYLIKSGKADEKVKAIFFRPTGLVYFFPGNGEPIIKPFTEFDGYINSHIRPNSGAKLYNFIVSHKTNPKLWFPIGEESYVEDDVFMRWEYVQQFMDISQPLPEAPEFARFRKLDPTTAKWDKEHQRPEDFYESMTDEDFDLYKKKTWELVKGCPWGLSREEAIEKGWTPPPEEMWKVKIK